MKLCRMHFEVSFWLSWRHAGRWKCNSWFVDAEPERIESRVMRAAEGWRKDIKPVWGGEAGAGGIGSVRLNEGHSSVWGEVSTRRHPSQDFRTERVRWWLWGEGLLCADAVYDRGTGEEAGLTGSLAKVGRRCGALNEHHAQARRAVTVMESGRCLRQLLLMAAPSWEGEWPAHHCCCSLHGGPLRRSSTSRTKRNIESLLGSVKVFNPHS